MMTGLRAGELRSLTPDSFNLTSQSPTVTVEACYSKHRRKDVLPLHPDMVPRLRQWLAKGAEADTPAILSLKSAPAGSVDRLWTGAALSAARTAETLRRDLKAARKHWIEAG